MEKNETRGRGGEGQNKAEREAEACRSRARFSFCWGGVVLFIGGGAGRPLQTEQSKVGEQPLSLLWVYSQWAGFVLAGWLPLRKPRQLLSWKWRLGLTLSHRDTATTTLQCLSLLQPEWERKGWRESDRDWGTSGSVWFYEGGKKRVGLPGPFWIVMGEKVEKKEGGKEKARSPLQYYTALIYVYSWFLHYSQD